MALMVDRTRTAATRASAQGTPVSGPPTSMHAAMRSLQRSVGNRATSQLIGDRARHGHGCGCGTCTAVIARTLATRLAVQRVPSRCNFCGTFFDDERQQFCPNTECGRADWDYVDEKAFCTDRGCPNYLIGLERADRHGKANGKYCEQCEKPLTSGVALVKAADATDERLSGPERELKALTERVEAHLQSSGTHHKTKSSGTSGARERHTSADHSQAVLNSRLAHELMALIDQVEELDERSVVLGPARSALSKIAGTHS